MYAAAPLPYLASFVVVALGATLGWDRGDESARERPAHSVLAGRDPKDPVVVRAVFRELGIAPSDLRLEMSRCWHGQPGATVLLPRGRVRLRDADVFRVAFDIDYSPPMELVLSRDGTAVRREMFAPEVTRLGEPFDAPLGALLREAADGPEGDWDLSLFFRDPNADGGCGGAMDRSSVKFTVVPDDPALEQRLSAIASRLADEPEILRVEVLAQALVNADLPAAALEMAWPLLSSHPSAGQLVATLSDALVRLRLLETGPYEEIVKVALRLPESTRRLLEPALPWH